MRRPDDVDRIQPSALYFDGARLLPVSIRLHAAFVHCFVERGHHSTGRVKHATWPRASRHGVSKIESAGTAARARRYAAAGAARVQTLTVDHMQCAFTGAAPDRMCGAAQAHSNIRIIIDVVKKFIFLQIYTPTHGGTPSTSYACVSSLLASWAATAGRRGSRPDGGVRG